MTSAIILAAGKSERMGKNKLLLPLHDKYVIEWVVDAVLKSNVDDIVIVTGRESDQIAQLIVNKRIKLIYNKAYKTGQASSIRVGLQGLNKQSKACFFIMGDQPFIDNHILNQMINQHIQGSILRPVNYSRKGSPVLFDACFYDELKTITGDNGGKYIIEHYSNKVKFFFIEDDMFFLDIDNISDYQECLKTLHSI